MSGIWKDLNNISDLENHQGKLLIEMALPLDKARDRIKSKCDIIVTHILKCIVYKNSTGDLNHWLQELGAWLDLCGDIVLKPRNKPINKNQYLDWMFQDWFSDKDNIRASLKFLIASCRDYPNIEITSELINSVYDIANQIIDKVVIMLQDKKLYSSNDYSKIIEEILSKNNIK